MTETQIPADEGAAAEDDLEIEPGIFIHALVQLVIDELKAAPDCWAKMSEQQQDDVIGRVERRVQRVARQVIALVSFEQQPHIPIVIDKVTVTGKVAQGTFTLPKGHEQLHPLVDQAGHQADLVVAPWELASEPHGVRPEPDQRGLDLAESTAAEEQEPAGGKTEGWPTPNEFGVFDEDAPVTLKHVRKKSHIRLRTIEINPNAWVFGYDFQVPDSHSTGPATANATYPSQDAAHVAGLKRALTFLASENSENWSAVRKHEVHMLTQWVESELKAVGLAHGDAEPEPEPEPEPPADEGALKEGLAGVSLE